MDILLQNNLFKIILHRRLKKKIPFYEKNTEKNLKKKFKQFKFTDKINDLKNCDLVFISQDVPTDFNGKSKLLEMLGIFRH